MELQIKFYLIDTVTEAHEICTDVEAKLLSSYAPQ